MARETTEQKQAESSAIRLGPPALVRLRADDETRVPIPTCDNEGQILYRSARVRIGHFARQPDDPRFRFSGLTGEHVLVFCQRSVRLQRMGEPPFVTDSMIVPLFNPDQIYFRHGVCELGERANWVGLDAELLATLQDEAGRGEAPSYERLWTLPYVRCDAWSYLVQAELVALLETAPETDTELVERAVVALARRAIHEEIRSERRRLGQPHRESTERRSAELVERARSLFVQEASERESLDAIARRIGCSASTLNRSFRQQLDVSVHQYRLQRRLRNALTELEAGDSNVTEVALRCGFSSHSHFTTAFRAKLGVTPSWVSQPASAARLERLLTND